MSSSEDERAVVVLAGCYVLLQEENRRRRKKVWQQKWLKRRDIGYGALHLLHEELRLEDRTAFKNFLRMNEDCFMLLLSKVEHKIKRKNTTFRESVKPRDRLSITLRFLATGESFQSLSYSFRVGRTTIGLIVTESINAIFECMKGEYIKAWLKTKRIILVCEECCLHLRETYKFLAMCLKNSTLLQRYMDNSNTSKVSNAENKEEPTLTSDMNIKNDVNEVKCEIKLEGAEMYIDECGPIIKESEDMFVNVDNSFVKEEDTWKREEVDDKEESPTDNIFTENSNKKMDSEISVNSNIQEIYKNDCRPIIEETEDVYPLFEQCFVKEEDTWKREEAGDEEEYPMNNNSTAGTDNEPNLEVSENINAHNIGTDLNRHTQVHAGWTPFKCSICGKCFGGKSYLVSHMRVHTGEKPFECSECGKCFKTQSQLNKHVWVHIDEKPFECSECDICFKTKLALNKHVKVHTGETRFKCSICEKCFSQKSYLLRHMRVHTGEKSFKCSICEKCFGWKSYLVNHMLIHTDEKPFECSKCGKRYRTKSVLNSHVCIHTSEKPFKCSTCEKCFGAKAYLARHMWNVHKVVL